MGQLTDGTFLPNDDILFLKLLGKFVKHNVRKKTSRGTLISFERYGYYFEKIKQNSIITDIYMHQFLFLQDYSD